MPPSRNEMGSATGVEAFPFNCPGVAAIVETALVKAASVEYWNRTWVVALPAAAVPPSTAPKDVTSVTVTLPTVGGTTGGGSVAKDEITLLVVPLLFTAMTRRKYRRFADKPVSVVVATTAS